MIKKKRVQCIINNNSVNTIIKYCPYTKIFDLKKQLCEKNYITSMEYNIKINDKIYKNHKYVDFKLFTNNNIVLVKKNKLILN